MKVAFLAGCSLALSVWACGAEDREFPNEGTAGTAGDSDASSGGTGDHAGGQSGGGKAGQSEGGEAGQGEGGAPEREPLTLEAVSLDDAQFNAAYAAELATSGGTGAPSFEVTGGNLPSGLSLTSEGVLAGVPLEGGTFEFTVTATDEAQGSDAADFILRVKRRRWLAYVADGKTIDQDLLYVVDVTSALLPSTLLSTEVQADGDVEERDYRFSADGSRLAFAIDKTVDAQKELFVVDLSGEEPSAPLPVETHQSVTAFDLTPDGKAIAYQVQTSPGAYELRYVDLSGSQPSAPLVIGPAGGSDVHWVRSDRIVYGTPGGNATVTRQADGFSDEEPLRYGTVNAIDHEAQRVVIAYTPAQCAKQAGMYDFNEGLVLHPAPAVESFRWPTYNRQLTRVAHPDGDGGMFVFNSDDTDGEPLGIVSPAASCGSGVNWSPDGNGVLMPDTASVARLIYSRVSDAGIESSPVKGSYGDVPYGGVGFVSNERFVFVADHQLFESRIDASGKPSEAAPINQALAATDWISGLRVAPNGSWVFYVGAQQTAGEPGPFAIDLRASEAGEPRALVVTELKVHAIGYIPYLHMPALMPAWSPDSSRLAFAADVGSSAPYVTRLYVADMLHPTALAKPITSAACDYSEPTVVCPAVRSFLFQP